MGVTEGVLAAPGKHVYFWGQAAVGASCPQSESSCTVTSACAGEPAATRDAATFSSVPALG